MPAAAKAESSETSDPSVNSFKVEGWNGSSWANKSNMLIGVNSNTQGVGTSIDSGMSMGGQNPTSVSCVQEYDGTAFSLKTALPRANKYSGQVGSTTSALSAGGRNTPGGNDFVTEYEANANVLGAGSQNWIGKVDFVTE